MNWILRWLRPTKTPQLHKLPKKRTLVIGILPCPQCNQPPEVVQQHRAFYSLYVVRCPECDVTTQLRGHEDIAIDRWNQWCKCWYEEKHNAKS